jgi:hypothetical protein
MTCLLPSYDNGDAKNADFYVHPRVFFEKVMVLAAYLSTKAYR